MSKTVTFLGVEQSLRVTGEPVTDGLQTEQGEEPGQEVLTP